MPFNETLANRIRKALARKRGITEKRMFGGLCFLLNGNMCCGVEKKDLVVRIGAENYEKAISFSNTRPMDFTGRILKGFVYVSPKGLKTDRALKQWIDRGTSFAASLPRKSKSK